MPHRNCATSRRQKVKAKSLVRRTMAERQAYGVGLAKTQGSNPLPSASELTSSKDFFCFCFRRSEEFDRIVLQPSEENWRGCHHFYFFFLIYHNGREKESEEQSVRRAKDWCAENLPLWYLILSSTSSSTATADQRQPNTTKNLTSSSWISN